METEFSSKILFCMHETQKYVCINMSAVYIYMSSRMLMYDVHIFTTKKPLSIILCSSSYKYLCTCSVVVYICAIEIKVCGGYNNHIILKLSLYTHSTKIFRKSIKFGTLLYNSLGCCWEMFIIRSIHSNCYICKYIFLVMCSAQYIWYVRCTRVCIIYFIPKVYWKIFGIRMSLLYCYVGHICIILETFWF